MAVINLDVVHRRLYSQLKLKEKAMKDNYTAWEIQSVLRQLKLNKYNTNDNMVFRELQRQTDEIITNATALMNQGHKGKGLEAQALFRRGHKTIVSTASADDIFEEELAAVIATIESKATNTIVNLDSKLVGQEALNIAFSEPSKKIIEEYPKFMERALNKKLTEKTRDYTGSFSRAGKTDVMGTVQFSGSLNPDWEYLFRLFQGKTFSVKNYSSLSKNTLISLGKTDYYKAIMGSLHALGYSEKYSQQIFYSALKKEISAPQHFRHLQIGYELMGLGLGKMIDGEFKEAQTVDFFIYNDPSSDAIVVKSTAQMLLDLMDNTTNRYVSATNISKEYFQQLGKTIYKKR